MTTQTNESFPSKMGNVLRALSTGALSTGALTDDALETLTGLLSPQRVDLSRLSIGPVAKKIAKEFKLRTITRVAVSSWLKAKNLGTKLGTKLGTSLCVKSKRSISTRPSPRGYSAKSQGLSKK